MNRGDCAGLLITGFVLTLSVVAQETRFLDPVFPFGAVYFRKSNPPEQDWERDHKTAAHHAGGCDQQFKQQGRINRVQKRTRQMMTRRVIAEQIVIECVRHPGQRMPVVALS